MKESPMLFSTEMVQAILDGRKTMTRRVIKPQPTSDNKNSDGTNNMPDGWSRWRKSPNFSYVWEQGSPGPLEHCPYGQPGDRLWVRETWFREECALDCAGKQDEDECPFNRVGESCYGYKTQYTDGGREQNIRWKPSIHMPKAAARIWLEVVNVRVERLHDITNDDAIAEGIKPCPRRMIDDCAIAEFSSLWDSLNAKRGYGWDVNPWVWVVEFKAIGA